jgi:hypothetical protein
MPRDACYSKMDVEFVWVSGPAANTLFTAATSAYYLGRIENTRLRNVAIGYNRDGSATTLSVGIVCNQCLQITNCIINATAQVTVDKFMGITEIHNLGYVDDAMVVPGSALESAIANPGINAVWYYHGSLIRSTAAKKTGDYGVLATPLATCSANAPLELSLYLPISSGDDLSVSVYGLRSQMTDDCAEIEIDPEGAWYTQVTGTVTMTNEDEFYEFTATRTGAGGTGAIGMVRIVLRVKEYEAANYFYWADFTATVGGVDYTVDFSKWSQGVPVASRVVTGGGGTFMPRPIQVGL